jgi:hypothetical protein
MSEVLEPTISSTVLANHSSANGIVNENITAATDSTDSSSNKNTSFFRSTTKKKY